MCVCVCVCVCVAHILVVGVCSSSLPAEAVLEGAFLLASPNIQVSINSLRTRLHNIPLAGFLSCRLGATSINKSEYGELTIDLNINTYS